MVGLETERLRKLLQQQEELAEQIQKEWARILDQQGREDIQRKIIAGTIALTHANEDQRFRTLLHDLLDRFVSTDEERALFGLPSKQIPGVEQSAAPEAIPSSDVGEEDPGADPEVR